MSTPTHIAVIAELEAGRQEVVGAAQGLSDEQAATKPAPDRWSVLECLEHLTTVEGRFLSLLATTIPAETLSGPGMSAEVRNATMQDRTTKRVAPEAVVPTGRFSTVAEALRAFQAARDKSVQAANEKGSDLDQTGVEHQRFGPMTGAQLMLLLNGHACRHAAQMREVRATLNF